MVRRGDRGEHARPGGSPLTRAADLSLVLEAAVKAAAIVVLIGAQHAPDLPGERLPVREAAEQAPQSVPTPSSAASWGGGPGKITPEQAAAYLRAAGFPESVVPTMVAIEERESGLCPSAVYGYGCNVGGTVHGSAACGLAQIYPCPGPAALDPGTNAALAYAKWQASGLAPWGG